MHILRVVMFYAAQAASDARYLQCVRRVRLVSALVVALVGLALTPLVGAQDGLEQGGEVSGEAAEGVAGTTVSPVEVSLQSFGVGGIARPGDWCAVRLGLTLNSTSAALPVAVRMHLDDIDGDTALYQRFLTLNSGVTQSAWFYVPLPSGTRSGDVFTVTVHEIVGEGEDVGRQITGGRVAVGTVVEATEGLIGVIGRRSLGLEAYELNDNAGGRFATANELVRVLGGLEVSDLPDSWVGYEPLRMLLWSGEDPSALSAAQSAAISEWVARGGHFVVAMSSVDERWFDDANPLLDLMPMVDARRVDSMDYGRVRNLITRSDEPYSGMALPVASAWVFERKAGATPSEAAVVAAGPEGGLIARRAVSTGLVTLIGLDLTRRDVARALRADSFWHKVTGERFDIPTPAELNNPDSTSYRNRLNQARTRPLARVDETIANRINRSASAGVGVLLALIVFVAYWVIAGPGGYGLLRWRGIHRLSWPLFLCATMVFAVIAWIGARAASPGSADSVQFSVFTSVQGTRGEHARTWASVLLPTYGDRVLSVRESGGEGSNVLSPWIDPENLDTLAFPDARSYVVDVSELGSVRFPSRGTVKQLRVDWHGGSRWRGIVLPDAEREPRLIARAGVWGLTGVLQNQFPGDLEDVQVVVSSGLRLESDRLSESHEAIGVMPVNAWAVTTRDGRIGAGETIDLSGFELSERARMTAVFDELNRGSPDRFGTVSLNDDRDIDRINWFGVIPPVSYRAIQPPARELRVKRSDTHGLDLTAWLTQPVLIVTGVLRTDGTDGPSQVLSPDALPTERFTVVRWICPLPGDGVVFTNSERSAD